MMMHNGITLHEKATLRELTALHAAAFSIPEKDVRKELCWLVEDASTTFVVARFDGNVAGYCVATPLGHYREQPLVSAFPYPLDGTAYVRFIACHPRMQGREIGQALLKECLDRAKEKSMRYGAGHFRDGRSHRIAKRVIAAEVDVPIEGYGRDGDLFHYVVGGI